MLSTPQLERQSNALTWDMAELDGNDAYHAPTNTLRIRLGNGRRLRVFLVTTGLFTEPSPERHVCVVLFNQHATSPDPNTVMRGLGFLIETQRFEEWKLASAANPTSRINATGEAGYGTDVVMKGRGGDEATGISIREDGSIILKGRGAEIVLGDGIVIRGQVHRDSPETRNSVMRSNPFRQFSLPSFCILPIPAEIPTLHLISQYGSAIRMIAGAL